MLWSRWRRERAWCDAMRPWFTVWLLPRCAAAVMRKIFFRRSFCATSVVRLFFLKKNTALWEQLQLLPGKYRAVLHLFYYEQLSVGEIGKLLGEKPATVRTQLTRARRLLRKQLKEEE